MKLTSYKVHVYNPNKEQWATASIYCHQMNIGCITEERTAGDKAGNSLHGNKSKKTGVQK